MERLKKLFNAKDISCIIGAFVFITLCSKSSFLYPLNDWGDTNCYVTMAKGILNGMVPYRDLIEQKGPAIFFIYTIAVLISGSGYFGVYVLELVFAFLFLRISLATISLFVDSQKHCYFISILLAAVVYSSSNFSHGGSAEEMLLFAFAYGVYLLLRYIEKRLLPNSVEMVVWGLLAGVIFFTKYNLCIIYISVIIFMVVMSVIRREHMHLFRMVPFFVIGCMVISALIFLYFGMNHSIAMFVERYFYNSAFKYLPADADATKLDVIKRIKNYFFSKKNVLFLLGIIAEFVWLFKSKRYYILAFVTVSFSLLFYFQLWMAIPRKYYGLPFCIYGLLGVCVLIDLFEKKNLKYTHINISMFLICMMLTAYWLSDNKYMMLKSKETCVQTVFANEMKSYGGDNYHMLYYGKLDNGFYQASQTLPNCPAFVTLNIVGDEFVDLQKQHINQRGVEFIVTFYNLCDTKELDKYTSADSESAQRGVVAFDDFDYELIDEQPYFFEGSTVMMKLYKLREL